MLKKEEKKEKEKKRQCSVTGRKGELPLKEKRQPIGL